MKLALGTAVLVIGAALFAIGVATVNEAFVLVGLILIPTGFFYGSHRSADDDDVVSAYQADRARSPYDTL